MKKVNNLLSTVIPPCLQFVCLLSLATIMLSFLVGQVIGATQLNIGKIIFWNVEYFFVLALFMELYDLMKYMKGKKLFVIIGLYSLSLICVWLSGNYLMLNFWMVGSILLGYVVPAYLAVTFHLMITISYCFIQNLSVEEFICYFTFGTLILLLISFLGKVKNMILIGIVAVTTNFAFLILLNDFELVYTNELIGNLISTGIMIVFLWVIQVVFDPLNRKEIKVKQELMEQLKSYSEHVYEHCLYIGELSEGAAKAIRANEDLAYVAGCYHEIGRMAGKEYIAEGVRILTEFGVSKQVIQVVEEHNIHQAAPTTKEAAIVMCSDSIVSTIQYLKTKQVDRNLDIDEIVDTVFFRRFEKGKFDHSTLSMEDIAVLKNYYSEALKET